MVEHVVDGSSRKRLHRHPVHTVRHSPALDMRDNGVASDDCVGAIFSMFITISRLLLIRKTTGSIDFTFGGILWGQFALRLGSSDFL